MQTNFTFNKPEKIFSCGATCVRKIRRKYFYQAMVFFMIVHQRDTKKIGIIIISSGCNLK